MEYLLAVNAKINISSWMFDGIVGLGPRATQERDGVKPQSFVYELWRQRLIAKPVFSIYLPDEDVKSE